MQGCDKKAGTAPESMDYCNPEHFMSRLSTGIRINVPAIGPHLSRRATTLPLELLPWNNQLTGNTNMNILKSIPFIPATLLCSALLFCGPAAAASIAAPVSGMPAINTSTPLYIVNVQKGVTPAQIKMGIQSGAEAENMNLVGSLDVQQGLKARGIKNSQPYVIYEVCNLVLGAKILKTTPEFGAFAPCKIVMYEQGGQLKLMTYLPTYALRYFPKNAESAKVANELDRQIITVMKQAAAGGL